MADVEYVGPRPGDSPGQRPTLGPGYDWFLELLRQCYRPLLGGIILGGLARTWLFGFPIDEVSLMVLAGLAGAFAGIRAAELTAARPGR